MASALLIGGTGQVGRAVARRLAESGWTVTVASRTGDAPDDLRDFGAQTLQVDRSETPQLEAAIGDGVDLVVDMLAMSRTEAEQINKLKGRVGSVVAISSASVYIDQRGHTLDEATGGESFPELPVPIPESHQTVEPSEETYSTRKVAMERSLLDGPLDATIVRPCAIHGPGSAIPRELYFVKRALDGRQAVVLVSRGESRFHTTSVPNLAELVRLAAERPAKRVVNCGDPNPPTVREIGWAVAAAIGHQFEEILIPETCYERPQLSNPWAVPKPLVVDMTVAVRELGYRPVTTYGDAVRETCEWLLEEAKVRDWKDTYLAEFFDYEAEDRLLAERVQARPSN
jgi:nucleoside-diphosphate-sugar epimerase